MSSRCVDRLSCRDHLFDGVGVRAASDGFRLVHRKSDGGGCVGWKGDGEAVLALFPVGDDGAVG